MKIYRKNVSDGKKKTFKVLDNYILDIAGYENVVLILHPKYYRKSNNRIMNMVVKHTSKCNTVFVLKAEVKQDAYYFQSYIKVSVMLEDCSWSHLMDGVWDSSKSSLNPDPACRSLYYEEKSKLGLLKDCESIISEGLTILLANLAPKHNEDEDEDEDEGNLDGGHRMTFQYPVEFHYNGEDFHFLAEVDDIEDSWVRVSDAFNVNVKTVNDEVEVSVYCINAETKKIIGGKISVETW